MEVTIPIALTIALTFITPFLISIVNRVDWSPEVKNLVAIAFSLAVAVAYMIFTGGVTDWSDLPVVFAAVFGLQQLIYQYILKNILKTVEVATDPNYTTIVAIPATNPQVITTEEDLPKDDDTSYVPIEELVTESNLKG